MKVKYHESQDIDIILSDEEFEKLISKTSEDFFDNTSIKVISLEARAYFYLGHCKNLIELTAYGHQLNKGVQLVLPEEQGDSYFINLLSEAVNELKREKEYSARYVGGAKLSIKIQNETME